MHYLFFDTETTGLPRNWKAPVSDVNNWPRLVQLGWLAYDDDGNKIDGGENLIRPEGFNIPIESSNVHGITQEIAEREGETLRDVLDKFHELVSSASILVAHNMNFDKKIMGAEFIREGYSDIIENKEKLCTMESTTDFCAIIGPYGYKWPGLSELHVKLFGEDFKGAHDAKADIEATARCFWELRSRGII